MKTKENFIVLSVIITMVFGACKKEKVEASLEEAGQIREYFIAAEEMEWDYSPSGINLFTGKPYTMDELVYLQNDTNRIGKKNVKAIYRLYTDNTFSTPLITTDDAQLGILGPVIRAEVGDQVKVVFKNRSMFKMSIHPHGVKYDTNNEGITGIDPGDTFTYQWDVPASAGPASRDGSSVCWMYHSHVMDHMGQDMYAGLVGPLVVYKKGMLKNNKAKDVDAERFAFFMVFDENASLYLDSNNTKYTNGNPDKDDPDYQESNKKHCINGLMFGNQQYKVGLGQNVRWYLFALGNEVDWHTLHWHGNTVVFRDSRTDVVSIGPANMAVADMKADNPGTWQFHCHVHDHMMAGMDALYTVQ
jgi:manganese oxidase